MYTHTQIYIYICVYIYIHILIYMYMLSKLQYGAGVIRPKSDLVHVCGMT